MKRKLILGIATAVLVAGCGGSGGSSGGGSQSVDLATISSANAVAVTAASFEAARSSGEFGSLAGSTGLIASDPGQTAKLDGSFGTASEVGGGSGTAQVPIPSTTEPCDVTGEVTISGRIEDPVTPTLTAGDFFEIFFNECVDVEGEMTDGLLRMDVDAFTGDFLSALYDMTLTLTVDAFAVTTAEEDVESNGAVTVRLDTEQAPYVEASVSGEQMMIVTGSRSESLLDFASTQTFDGTQSPAPYTFTASGTLDSSQLAGAVRYSTPVTFQGFDEDYPSSGEFLVEGQNSAAKLVVANGVQVLILLDADGNGEFEQEIETTWEELASQ